MDMQRLIRMANQIGAYFASEPDRAAAAAGVADHLARFWEPRMRRQLSEYLEGGGDGLDPLVAEALRSHRGRLHGDAQAI